MLTFYHLSDADEETPHQQITSSSTRSTSRDLNHKDQLKANKERKKLFLIEAWCQLSFFKTQNAKSSIRMGLPLVVLSWGGSFWSLCLKWNTLINMMRRCGGRLIQSDKFQCLLLVIYISQNPAVSEQQDWFNLCARVIQEEFSIIFSLHWLVDALNKLLDRSSPVWQALIWRFQLAGNG